MSKSTIEVRVHAKGSVREGTPNPEPSTQARCDLCHGTVDATVSMGAEGDAPFACKSCLRERLEAITLGMWLLRDGSEKGGLPWGKISG